MPINGELTFPDVPGKINEHNQSPNAHSVRIDNTVSQPGMAADAKATRDLVDNVSGQIEEEIDALDGQVTDLKSAIGNKSSLNTDTKTNLVSAINEVNGHFLDGIEEGVENWLDDHPEATTTVQDGSLTEAKFSSDLALKTVKDYVTPEMFGAKGDGVTDDTVAVQSALSYAYSNNVPLYLLSKYLLTSGLTVNSGVHIKGTRPGAGFNVNSDIVALTLPANSVRQKLENFGFTMQGRVGSAIKVNYVRWVTISDIYIMYAHNAIEVDDAYYCNIYNCDIHYCEKGIILKDCGGITITGTHINESQKENIYIQATSSVDIVNCTLESALSVGQVVCDSGDISISTSYIGDSDYPDVLVNGGNVSVSDIMPALLRMTQNGGSLFLNNVRWGGATTDHRIRHNGGRLKLGNHFVSSYLDIDTSKYEMISAPTRRTYSPAGLFLDTSDLILGSDTSIHEYGTNYHGGSRIKVYSSSASPTNEADLKIPFSIPPGLIDKPLILKIAIDNKDRMDNPSYRPSGDGGNNAIRLRDQDDLYIANWSDIDGGSPISNNLYNYSDSWKCAFISSNLYNQYQIYIPIKARHTSGYIEFFGVRGEEYDKMFGFEYIALLNPVDAYMFAKYI